MISENCNLIVWLQHWIKHCRLDNVSIGTLDNPGWFLKVNLNDTAYVNQDVMNGLIENTDYDWYECFMEDKIFKGYGGPLNLIKILSYFRKWIKKSDSKNGMFGRVLEANKEIVFLQNWYLSQCDGDWEHQNGVTIKLDSKFNWLVSIDLTETGYKDNLFPKEGMHVVSDHGGRFFCSIKEIITKDMYGKESEVRTKFEGWGEINNLTDILKAFASWAEINKSCPTPWLSSSHSPLLRSSPPRTERTTFNVLRSSINKVE